MRQRTRGSLPNRLHTRERGSCPRASNKRVSLEENAEILNSVLKGALRMVQAIITPIHKDEAILRITRAVMKGRLSASNNDIVEVMIEEESERWIIGRTGLSPDRPHKRRNGCVSDIPFALRQSTLSGERQEGFPPYERSDRDKPMAMERHLFLESDVPLYPLRAKCGRLSSRKFLVMRDQICIRDLHHKSFITIESRNGQHLPLSAHSYGRRYRKSIARQSCAQMFNRGPNDICPFSRGKQSSRGRESRGGDARQAFGA